MADFLVLPTKTVLGEHVAHLLRPLLPGVGITALDGVRLIEAIVAAKAPDTVLVHRDDLPEGEDLATALRDGFGAGPHDRIIPVKFVPQITTEHGRVAPVVPEIPTIIGNSPPTIR